MLTGSTGFMPVSVNQIGNPSTTVGSSPGDFSQGSSGGGILGNLKKLLGGGLTGLLGALTGSGGSADSVGSSVFDIEKFMNQYNEQAKQATEEQRNWSAEQAQKQMDFQEYMSSTAYQRAVEDMKAAGLNPYMLMAGANSASAGTGAMASTDARDVYSSNDYLTRDKMILDFISSMTTSATKAASMLV